MAEFVVPMKFTKSGDAFVIADNADEALKKAEAGQWSHCDMTAGETSDWEVTGPAELNE